MPLLSKNSPIYHTHHHINLIYFTIYIIPIHFIPLKVLLYQYIII